MTTFELVREYFPGLTDTQANDLLWSHTGWPGFWNIPEDGNTPEECLRNKLQDLKDNGFWEDPVTETGRRTKLPEG